MRILVAFILVFILGGIVAAAYSIPHVNLTPTQVDQIQNTCAECHKVPVVTSSTTVHNAHLNLDCAVCHPGGNRERVNFNSCVPCHSIPQYTSSVSMHNAHAGTDCIVCHGTTGNLTTPDKANGTLQAAGIGLTTFGLLGIIINYIVARSRLKNRG